MTFHEFIGTILVIFLFAYLTRSLVGGLLSIFDIFNYD